MNLTTDEFYDRLDALETVAWGSPCGNTMEQRLRNLAVHLFVHGFNGNTDSVEANNQSGQTILVVKCDKCDGTGTIGDSICPKCGGAGNDLVSQSTGTTQSTTQDSEEEYEKGYVSGWEACDRERDLSGGLTAAQPLAVQARPIADAAHLSWLRDALLELENKRDGRLTFKE